MDQADKTELLEIINSKFNSGMGVDRSDILRTKMELETAESQLRSAIASERNARYMLWAVIAAAVSALASLASTAIVVLEHH
jgi:outer membrane protein TolC